MLVVRLLSLVSIRLCNQYHTLYHSFLHWWRKNCYAFSRYPHVEFREYVKPFFGSSSVVECGESHIRSGFLDEGRRTEDECCCRRSSFVVRQTRNARMIRCTKPQ